VTVTGEADRRDPDTGQLAPAADPTSVFEIEHVDGDRARELRVEQARAVSEVLQWLVHNHDSSQQTSP
jgi:hypothetical protein